MIVEPSMGELMRFGGRRPPGLVRRPSARGGNASKTELQNLEDYLAKNLFSWMRPDYRSEAGGKVTAFGDKVALVSEGAVAPNARSADPAHAYFNPGSGAQVAAIAPMAMFGNREAAVFTGPHYYDSTLAKANWAFLQSGANMEATSVYAPNANTLGFLLSSYGVAAGAGLAQYVNTGPLAAALALVGGGVVAVNTFIGALTLNTPCVVVDSLFGAAWSHSLNGVVQSSGTASGLSAAAPDFTLRIGGRAGTAGVQGLCANVADVQIANKNDATLRAAQKRYRQLRYGMAA